MRSRLALVAALVIALAGVACTSSPSTQSAKPLVPGSKDVQYAPGGAGFTVKFPTYHGDSNKIRVAPPRPDNGVQVTDYVSILNREVDQAGNPVPCSRCPVYTVTVGPDSHPEKPVKDHIFPCSGPGSKEAKPQDVDGEEGIRTHCNTFTTEGKFETHVLAIGHGGRFYQVHTLKVKAEWADAFFKTFHFTS